MPNFAQEYPILIFLPVIIFAAVAAIAGLTHLAVPLRGKTASHRAAPAPTRRNFAFQVRKPVFAESLRDKRMAAEL